MLVLLAGRALPPRAQRAIGLVAPAALSGLVGMMLIGRHASANPAQLIAVITGSIAVRRTQNVLHAFVVGLPVFAAATLIV
jgi:branched-subunit amino acid transport protein